MARSDRKETSAYRSAPREEPPRVIAYGPFTRRWFELGIGLGGGTLLLVVGAAMLHDEALICDRATGACAIEQRSVLLPDRRNAFPISAVAEVRWSTYKQKSSEMGRTDLIWRSGAQTSIFSGDRDEASATYQRIDAFFKDPGARTLEVTGDTPWLIAAFFAAMAAFLLAIGVSAARPPSLLSIAVTPKELVVTQRWFGVPLRRKRFLRGKARDVRIEKGVVRTFAQPSNRPPPPAARLVIKGGGADTPLTERFLVGSSVHDAAARALRAALRDEPEPRPDVRSSSTARPARKRLTPTVLVVIGIAAAAILAQATLMLHADRTQGTLDVTCKQRCRFGGAECLPGGSWRGTFNPGEYTIEVWNPDAPTKWDSHPVSLRVGETTQFVCAPPAPPPSP